MARQGGKIILLNGASSSGKSSVARVLQITVDEPFWRISFDHLRDAGALPLARFQSGEFNWADFRDRFFVGYERSLAAFAETGNNLIVDYIVETEAGMGRLVTLFSPFDVFFVGVHCALDELERRETARGDRARGDARRDYHAIHRHARYDMEVDTTDARPERVAEEIVAAWRARVRPSAFDAMG